MSKAPNDVEAKKCVTPEFRVSFPAVFEPKLFEGQKEAKYSVTMLFDKKTDLTALKKIARAAGTEKWGADQKKWPKFRYAAFRDGDAEKPDTVGYENTIFCTAKSKVQPGLVDGRRQAILSQQDFYAGCYARAEIIAYAYDQAGNKGIGFALQNIQKLRDGERLSGRKEAADVFDEVADASESEESYNTEATDDNAGDSLGF